MYYRFYADDNTCFEGETLRDVTESVAIYKAESEADTLFIKEIYAEYICGRQKELCAKAIEKANNLIDEIYYREKEELEIARRDFNFDQYR